MGLIFVIFIEFLAAFLLKQLVPQNILEMILITINFILTTFYLRKNIHDKKLFLIIYGMFILRVMLVFIDVYVFKLPLSGNDTENFHNEAIRIAKLLPSEKAYSPYGTYPEILGIAYYIIGPMRTYIQNINVILYILSAINIIKIFKIYSINKGLVRKYIFIYLAMIIGICESTTLLRESLLILILSYSIYYFVKFINFGGNINILIAIFYAVIAANLHTGVIAVLPVYIAIFILYDRCNNKLNITIKTLAKFIFIIAVSIFILSIFKSTFSYVDDIKNLQDLFDELSGSGVEIKAGSTYLANLKIENILQLALYTPIRLFYFLFSPVPWNFRGFIDIATFIMDSIVYLIFSFGIVSAYRCRENIPINIRHNIYILYLCGFSISIMYSLGVSTAGTAIRHRFKIFFIFLIAYTLYKNYKSKVLDS